MELLLAQAVRIPSWLFAAIGAVLLLLLSAIGYWLRERHKALTEVEREQIALSKAVDSLKGEMVSEKLLNGALSGYVLRGDLVNLAPSQQWASDIAGRLHVLERLMKDLEEAEPTSPHSTDAAIGILNQITGVQQQELAKLVVALRQIEGGVEKQNQAISVLTEKFYSHQHACLRLFAQKEDHNQVVTTVERVLNMMGQLDGYLKRLTELSNSGRK